MTPLVSIVLTTYNGQSFLRKQLDSLAAQDYGRFELVVRDDASTDQTMAILEAFVREHPEVRVTVRRNERNLGFVKNFERVLAEGEGELIALCDQDDVWHPRKLSSLVEAIERQQAGLVFCNADLINEQDQPIDGTLWSVLGATFAAPIDRRSLYLENRITGCTMLLRRALLQWILPIPPSFEAHDGWIAFVAAASGPVAFVPEPLMSYRVHANNTIGVGRRVKKRRSLATYYRQKRQKLHDLREDGANTVLRLRACLQLERSLDLDTSTLEGLIEWAKDRRVKWGLSRHKSLFENNPVLFAMGRPEVLKRRVTKSIPRYRLAAMAEAFLPTLAVAALLLGCAILLFGGSTRRERATVPTTPPLTQHVFLVSIDGGKPSVMQTAPMPRTLEMARDGASTWRAQTVMPSLTLVSHASMVTGVEPDTHDITWNTWRPDKGTVDVPTLFELAKKAGYRTAMFASKEKFRHFDRSGSLDKLVARDLRDLSVVDEAVAYIESDKPNVCLIHLPTADLTGHASGWGSVQQVRALGEIDQAIGRIISAVERAGILSKSVFIITADHGGHGKTHGSDSPEDMTIPWIAFGQRVRQRFEIPDQVITYDSAATVLWLLGVPVPTEWDGRPVQSAFIRCALTRTGTACAD